jgi:riboflavin biosynthesis pyrimidine reductase
VGVTEPPISRVWPDASAPLTDHDLLEAYAMPEGPTLRLNFVSSVDGSATLDGRSGTLGGAADKRVFHLLRVVCDAVVVAAGTIRVERYGPDLVAPPLQDLRRERGRPPFPVLVIVTRSLDLDPDAALFTQAGTRPIIVTTEATAKAAGARFAAVADVLGFGGEEVDLAASFRGLDERGLPHLLCEGGPHLLGALTAADLVDEFCLTLAPKLVGPGPGRISAGSPSPVRALALSHVLAAGEELFLRYRRG